MKTTVITGGTDGIGAAVARARLDRGDTVVVIGRSAAKGEAFRRSAAETGAADRAHYLIADLSRIDATRRVAADLALRYPRIDALVLCARYLHSRRTQTSDGLETGFALFYLSRYLLSEDLAPALSRSDAPTLVNVAGPGPTSGIRWDDLQLARHYDLPASLSHGGRLNDLHAAGFAARHPGIGYVLVNPGATATSVSGEYDAADAGHVAMLRRHGQPASQAAAPIVGVIDDPPSAALTVLVSGRRVPIDKAAFDPADAQRLASLTRDLLADR